MDKIYEFVKTLYKNEKGEPFELTPTQLKVFEIIAKRKYPRTQFMSYTQFGKSETVALAVLTRVCFFPEKWAIVAPDMKRAKILIEKIINHIFDNPLTISKFQISEGESLERIRRERSKNRLTFNTGDGIGEVFIVSAQTRFKGEDAGNALMGFGAPNLIEEEASLIPDEIHAKAIRMIGGHKDNFLIKIGNPFKRNHFFRSWQNPNYHKIFADWRVGVKEGRITEKQVKEYKDEIPEYLFDILYECKFPPEEGLLRWKPEYERIGKIDLKEFQIFSIGTDLAISEKTEADETAWCVAGLGKDGKIYIIASDKGHWEPDDSYQRFTNQYRFYNKIKTTILGIEDVAYQRAAIYELGQRYGVPAFAVKRVKDKVARVLSIQPYFQNGQIIFFPGNEELLRQLKGFGTIDEDDLVDAFEMAVSLIKDHYLLEKKEEHKETLKEKLIKRALEKKEEEYYE